jgi:hypothetical protein
MSSKFLGLPLKAHHSHTSPYLLRCENSHNPSSTAHKPSAQAKTALILSTMLPIYSPPGFCCSNIPFLLLSSDLPPSTYTDPESSLQVCCHCSILSTCPLGSPRRHSQWPVERDIQSGGTECMSSNPPQSVCSCVVWGTPSPPLNFTSFPTWNVCCNAWHTLSAEWVAAHRISSTYLKFLNLFIYVRFGPHLESRCVHCGVPASRKS